MRNGCRFSAFLMPGWRNLIEVVFGTIGSSNRTGIPFNWTCSLKGGTSSQACFRINGAISVSRSNGQKPTEAPDQC